MQEVYSRVMSQSRLLHDSNQIALRRRLKKPSMLGLSVAFLLPWPFFRSVERTDQRA